MTATTLDEFLGGRIVLEQPKQGYRAGIDPVLLAASVDAKEGQSVLELGCGAGAASLCLAARVPNLTLCGVEIQSEYAELCRSNALRNGIDMQVVMSDFMHLPADWNDQSFDHVIANPPYFDRTASTSSPNLGRDTAMGVQTALTDWINIMSKRVKPKGYITLIHRADALAAILTALPGYMASVEVRPIYARASRDARLILVRARKNGRAALRLCAPLVLHDGDQHTEDKDSYSPQVSKILRHGDALGWG